MDAETSTVGPSRVEPGRLIRASGATPGLQGLDYSVGVSAESVGAHGLHMQLVHIPPGGRAKRTGTSRTRRRSTR